MELTAFRRSRDLTRPSHMPRAFRRAYKMVSSLLTPFLFPHLILRMPQECLIPQTVSISVVLVLFCTIWHQISVSINILSRKLHGQSAGILMCACYLYLYAFISQNMPRNMKIGWEMGEIQPISMISEKLGIPHSFLNQKKCSWACFKGSR